MAYDSADRLTKITYPSGQFLEFAYDAGGRRTQSVDQDGFTVNYSYDAAGRLSELTDGNGNLIVQYSYDAAGNLIQKTNGNGTYTTYTYDAAGNVLSITNYASASGPVNSFDVYTYDALGKVLSDTNQDGESGPPRHFFLSFLGFSIVTNYRTYTLYLLSRTKATTNIVKRCEDVPQRFSFPPNAELAIRPSPPILMRWPWMGNGSTRTTLMAS